MARLELATFAEDLVATVVLSRRNLLALLAKLEMPASARTLLNNDCFLNGQATDNVLLMLRAEDDAAHYGRRPDPPGEMHPQTERFVREHGGWSRIDH